MKFTDNSKEIKNKVAENRKIAVKAIGLKAVELIVDKLENGYDKPIRITGDLMRSISSGNETDSTVDVGSNMEYAEYVHDGTSKMSSRPFIKDAILQNKDEIKQIAESYLKDGM